MRILYVSNANIIGGATIALLNLIKGIRALGHDVLVVTVKGDGHFLEMLDQIGCKYVQAPIEISVYPRNYSFITYLPKLFKMILNNVRAFPAVYRTICDFKPDIVHTNVGPLSLPYYICRMKKIPHVWHQREYQDLGCDYHFFPSVSSFLRLIHHPLNHNICVSQGVFNYYHCRQGTDRVIYDGVFSQDIEIPEISLRDSYVLFVGRVLASKGTLDAIHAFKEFHNRYPSVSLKIAGPYVETSMYYQQCLKFVSDNDLTECVEILGDRRDVYELMRHSLMLLVPSLFEGFGFITTEAMLNGCPVIGRDTGGTKEQFDNGLALTGDEIGFRFTNEEEMLQAMIRVMETDTSELCKRAKRTVLELYTIERHVHEVERYYRYILNNREN